MSTSNIIRFAACGLIFAAGFSILISAPRIPVASAAEVTLDRAAREFKMPDQIPWSAPSQSGTQTATLLGNPQKPGLYIQMLKRPPNNWSGPHKHDHTRYITVISGTMWVGTGTDFDKEKTVPLHAGSFLVDYANQTHYDGSKDEGLVIEIIGTVPAK